MLAIGTPVRCAYNQNVAGTVVGYGVMLDVGKAWSVGIEPPLPRSAYLVALTERIGLYETEHKRVVSVMVIEERNAEAVVALKEEK